MLRVVVSHRYLIFCYLNGVHFFFEFLGNVCGRSRLKMTDDELVSSFIDETTLIQYYCADLNRVF